MTTTDSEALTALRGLELTIHRMRSIDSGTERWPQTKEDTDAALAVLERCNLLTLEREHDHA